MANVKIPKRVGGMKIPRKVRKRANEAIKMAESPALRDLAAAALGAAGAARRVSTGARIKVDGKPLSAAATIQIDANRFGEAFRTAAVDGFRRFLEGFEEGLRDLGATIDAEPKAKPKAPARPKSPAKPKPAAKPKPVAKPKTARAKPRSATSRSTRRPPGAAT